MARKGMAVVTARCTAIEEAHEVVGRLSQAGFARNSIHVDRDDEGGFEVRLHVREANRDRAEEAIRTAHGGFEVGRLPSAGTALAIGIGAVAIGAGIVAALAARTMIPRYLRDGERDPAAAPREE
jgi:hypothetical protein